MEEKKLESVACDFCGSKDQRHKIRRLIGLEVGECAACGLAFVNPRPSWPAMLAHYRSSYGSRQTMASCERHIRLDIRRADVQRITSLMELKDAVVLDVGCSTGVFLHALKRAGAKRLVGVEPNSNRAELAKAIVPDAEILEEAYETVSCENHRFDLVAANDLIEHLYAPSEFFSFAQQVLGPGGFLYIRTPNWWAAKKYSTMWKGLQRDYEHVYYFDRLSLEKYLGRYGFKPVAVDYEPTSDGWGRTCSRQPQLEKRTANDETRSPLSDTSVLRYAKQMASDIPLMGRGMWWALWQLRYYANYTDIKKEAAHELIMLAQKEE